MTRFLTCLLALALLPNLSRAASPAVTLVQESTSVKVMIGDDVFTVFHYGKDRRKPFFLPVTGPGGFELLKSAIATKKQGDVSRKVVVASESVTLKKENGTGRTVHWGDILDIGQLDGNQLQIAGTDEWISRADIAPAAALVVRLINDDPDKKNAKDALTGDRYDHVHHKGIWFAVDAIQSRMHWAEESLIQTQNVKLAKSGTPAAEIHFVNHWLDDKEQPLMVETTTVTITSERLLIYDTVLSPAVDQLHIGDTKEGLLAIRLAGTMREQSGGGPVTTSEGLETTKEAWGKPARWVNYDGPVAGHVFGVAIMDSPKNPWPSRYHVRNYGLFSINPFGAGAYTEKMSDPQPKHDETLNRDESLHFKYGIWVHGADVTREQLEAMYQKL